MQQIVDYHLSVERVEVTSSNKADDLYGLHRWTFHMIVFLGYDSFCLVENEKIGLKSFEATERLQSPP